MTQPSLLTIYVHSKSLKFSCGHGESDPLLRLRLRPKKLTGRGVYTGAPEMEFSGRNQEDFSCTRRLHLHLLHGGALLAGGSGRDGDRRNITRLMARAHVAAASSTNWPALILISPARPRATHPSSPPPDPVAPTPSGRRMPRGGRCWSGLWRHPPRQAAAIYGAEARALPARDSVHAIASNCLHTTSTPPTTAKETQRRLLCCACAPQDEASRIQGQAAV